MIVWLLPLGLALVFAVVLLPTRGTDRRRLSTGTWVGCWLAIAAIVPVLGFLLGWTHFELTECSGGGSGECDLAGMAGLIWGAGALVMTVLAWVADAVRRLRQPARER
ncbi:MULTISPECIES: hypothetical protein [unclassified Nocardioides]|uniref:hypothetical protein n=1 Tax=unclassified Nocardioides TaxID=2615069 RepID=UPI0030142AB5